MAILSCSTPKAQSGSCRRSNASCYWPEMLPLPLQFIIAMVTYAVNERMARRFDYLLEEVTHLFHDRDPLFTSAWVELLKSSGVESVRIPASSPNCSPHAERFVRTVRNECLNQFVIFGERHLRYLLRDFIPHYLEERVHQGLGGALIAPRTASENDNSASDAIRCRSRLGGLLNFYHREAA